MSSSWESCQDYQQQQQSATSQQESLECVASALSSNVQDVDDRVDSLEEGIDIAFLILASIIMFLMQAGFAMFCAGSVRRKNVQNTMLKNFLDACGSAIAFFVCGYALAFGGSSSPYYTPTEDTFTTTTTTSMAGNQGFFLIDVDDYAFWLYQYAFCATTATIVAGTLAERSQMVAYFGYSILLAGVVYPLIAHAVWSPEGFLSASSTRQSLLWDSGMVDIAGSGVVHVTGGLTALIASYLLGPRSDRFHDDLGNPLHTPKHIQGYSTSLQVLGTFLLWVGWFGFNAGSIHVVSSGEYARIASLAAINTTLSAAASTVVALGISAYWTQHRTGETLFDITYALNGCLSGLVAITGGCAVVEPWAALFIGSMGGIIYLLASGLLIHWRIDDAVDAIPVHLFNGIWGVIAVGLLASPYRMEAVYQRSDHVGWFYSWGRGSGDATLLGTNIIGLLCIATFVLVVMLPFFWILLYMGWFRSDPLEEIVGLDMHYRGTADHDSHHFHRGMTSGHHLVQARHHDKAKAMVGCHFDRDVLDEKQHHPSSPPTSAVASASETTQTTNCTPNALFLHPSKDTLASY